MLVLWDVGQFLQLQAYLIELEIIKVTGIYFLCQTSQLIQIINSSQPSIDIQTNINDEWNEFFFITFETQAQKLSLRDIYKNFPSEIPQDDKSN